MSKDDYNNIDGGTDEAFEEISTGEAVTDSSLEGLDIGSEELISDGFAQQGLDTEVTDEDVSAEGRFDATEDDFEDEWDDDFEGSPEVKDNAKQELEQIEDLDLPEEQQPEEQQPEEQQAQDAALEQLPEEQPLKQQQTIKQEQPIQAEQAPTAKQQAQQPLQESQEQLVEELPPQEDVPLAEEQFDMDELEAVRQATSDIDSQLVDVSAIEQEAKTRKASSKKEELTEDEKKAAKEKAAAERKRKRQEENDIFANRYKAKTINAAVAQTSPIVYFYNAALQKDGAIKFFNVYQVLQDRFLGKIIPQLWTAVAESSDRVLELNMANLAEHLNICAEFPDYEFVISISTRFFTKPAVLDKLLALIVNPVSNLVMAFDSVSLQNLGTAAKTGLGFIREKGIKVMLENTERVSMTSLSELEFDYMRIDSRYYELGNFKAEGFLRLLTQFSVEQGIPTVATFCDNEDMAEYMFYMGVDIVQGNAVCRPMRTVPNAVKATTLLESMKAEEGAI